MKPVSYHAFLFPFKWEILSQNMGNKMFNERIKLSEFEDLIFGKNENENKWKRKPFELKDSYIGYNEYYYYYDFVRDVIYDRGDATSLENAGLDGNSLVKHYEYIFETEDNHFWIVCNIAGSGVHVRNYELKINKIFLDVYETGVAVLSFHLLNYHYDSPEDILNINQFGRRAFIGGFQLGDYPCKEKRKTWNSYVDLADFVHLKIGDKSIFENFDYGVLSDFEKQPFQLPNYFSELFYQNHLLTTNWYDCKGLKENEKKIWISPSIDDRMFTVSWYCCDIEKYKKSFDRNGTSSIKHTSFWYKYIFVDSAKGESQVNGILKQQLIENSTYDRWLDYNTLYGISRYSFVMFCENTQYTPDYLKAVHETMYLKMAELCLVQRASVLRFSDEIQHVTSLDESKSKSKSKSKSNVSEHIQDLYKHHMRFLNKIDFQEVTAQQQGIELYDMLRDKMQIERHIDALDKEINQLHNYALLIEDKRRNDRLDTITYIGVPLTILSVIISLIGFFKDVKVKVGQSETYGVELPHWVLFLEISIGLVISTILYKIGKKNKLNLKIPFQVLLILLLSILMIILPFIRILIF